MTNRGIALALTLILAVGSASAPTAGVSEGA
jgi:hypothetical protein